MAQPGGNQAVIQRERKAKKVRALLAISVAHKYTLSLLRQLLTW
jgi:hypothetical protein